MGQPTKYDPKFCALLVEHMRSGGSFAAFASIAEVARQTLHTWVNVYPEFKDAKDLGESHALLWWERQSMSALWTDKNGDVFNNTVWVFTMKNRFGWRDKIEQDVAASVSVEASNGQAYLDTLKKVLDAREYERKG